MKTPAPKITFARGQGDFSRVLKHRVDDYFRDNHLERTANTFMVFKIVFWVSAPLFLLSVYLFGGLSTTIALLVAAMIGFSNAQIGFNVSHDAVHGALSKKPWVNRAVSLFMEMIGGNTYTWSISHNYVHHTYTNVPHVDNDLDPGFFLRFHPGAPRYWFHRYQHLYAWFLYGMTTLVWSFKKDWVQIALKDPRTNKRPGPQQIAELVVGKAVHFGMFIGLPLLFSPYDVPFILFSYLVLQFVSGASLAIVFQLAHVVEGPIFPVPSDDGILKSEWAAHQLQTTANFATTNPLALFLTGGLNFQVEHHLFSKICHVHYPAISKIVRATALEFSLPYHNSGSFTEALHSHFRVMYQLGHDDVPAGLLATFPEAAANRRRRRGTSAERIAA